LFGPVLYRLLIRHVPAKKNHVRKIVYGALGFRACLDYQRKKNET
jgi:hypothetical protein